MAYKSRKARKAGGRTDSSPNQYNAQGSPEEKSETAKSDGFKRGGAKRAHGGHVEGEKAKHHMGKRARGGSIGRRTHGGAMKMGGSPYSSAHAVSGPGNAKGSPGEQAPSESG